MKILLYVLLAFHMASISALAQGPLCSDVFSDENLNLPLLRYAGQTGGQYISKIRLGKGLRVNLKKDLIFLKGKVTSEPLQLSADHKIFNVQISRLDEGVFESNSLYPERSTFRYEGARVGYITQPRKEVSLSYFGAVLLLFSREGVTYKMSMTFYSTDHRRNAVLTPELVNQALDLLFTYN